MASKGKALKMYPLKCRCPKDEKEEQFVAMQMSQMELEPQNPTTPIVTLDQVEKSSHLIWVLMNHNSFIEDLLAKARAGYNDDELSKVTMGHDSLQVPLLPFDDLRPQDLVDLAALALSPNRVLWGKYLLCQTISKAIKHVGLEVVVTDPKGANAMRLILHNYSSVEKSELEVNFDEILPPGSFLVLKNPWFTLQPCGCGCLVLSCENPAEVDLVSRKRVEAKFPDLEWIGAIATKAIHNSQQRHFWRDLKDEQAAFEKLKGLGNKGFADKRFSDAIRFYDMAIDYCNGNKEDEAIIHSNKSAALLGLGCFNAALKCMNLALEVKPASEKYIYRKTKALIGLGKYDEGLSFLEKKFDQCSSLHKNKDCTTLLENARLLSSRKNLGPTDSQLLSIRILTLNKDEIIPEFTGPFAISQIEGKGRGLIATKNIRPGQLILCNRAFVYHTAPKSRAANLAEKLKGKIANMLTFDPDLGPELYNLTAGAELGHLEPGDCRTRHVDMRRILGIVDINMIGNAEQMTEKGLWIAHSFFNHSCSEYNCIVDFCGEWMSVRAIADIKNGEELTLGYQSPAVSYEGRQRLFNKQGFTCNCKLCQLEAIEPTSVHNERKAILQFLGKLTTDCGPKEIGKALYGVEKLISLRKDNVPLNFPLFSHEVGHLGEILIKKGLIGEEIAFTYRKYEVAAASGIWQTEGITLAANLVIIHAALGDKKSANFWMANVKRLVMKFYGNLEYMRFKGRDAVKALKDKFDIDFFDDE